MLNGTPWQQRHADFMNESLVLLNRAEECVTHLEMIADDPDAIECLNATLHSLSAMASLASIDTVADFTRRLLQRLVALQAQCLGRDALQTLRHCLDLLAWQLELIDPGTGKLSMDDQEQHELLKRLASLAVANATEHC